jgi:hypothetical protein
MEYLQVNRVRFGAGTAAFEADLIYDRFAR